MATVKEIISLEDGSLQHIRLYHEGIFYKAYNESACLFHKLVRKYQVKSKYCKKEGQTIYSLGFPQSSLASILDQMNQPQVQGYPATLTVEANQLSGFCQLQKPDYEEWCIQWDNNEVYPQHDVDTQQPTSRTPLAQRILSFSLLNCTPLECMNFINQLQTDIRNGYIS